MRKKNREITQDAAWRCFDEASYATLALAAVDGTPYLVPLSMARIEERVYFHCAMAGQKWEMLQQNPKVSINAVSQAVINEPGFSVNYVSCTMQGHAEIVTDEKEKLQALYAICEKYCPSQRERFADYLKNSVTNTGIVKVVISSITGKHNPITPI